MFKVHRSSWFSSKAQHGFREESHGQRRGSGATQEQTFTHRCRCACSHALFAARTPFPPHSAALITPGALEPATAAAPAASVAAMATAESHATVRLPAPPYRCPRRPFWAAVVVGIARSRWYRTDVPPPAAFQEQSSSRQLRTCIPHAQHNEHAACWLRSPHRSAGRGRSELESRVSPSGRAFTVRMRKV